MSTAVAERPITAGVHVNQLTVLRSEWIKFRSLRSTMITLLVSVALSIAISALICGSLGSNPSRIDSDFDATSISLAGIGFSQLSIGVLGVLCVTGEYKTGMISSSLAAVPRRLPVLWGKALTLVALILPLSLISSFASFFIGQALLKSGHLNVSLSSDHAVRKIIGSALYLAVAGLIGLAIGVLLRSSAGGITLFVGLFFVIPPLLNFFSTNIQNDTAPYLPAGAGQALWSTRMTAGTTSLAPWTGFAVMCAWAAVLLIAAAIRLTKSDV